MKQPDKKIESGIRNLDEILEGGIPEGSLTMIVGAPGTGKTILSHQIAFKNAAPNCRVLIFQTLSEPSSKSIKHLAQFDYYDSKMIEDGTIQFVDLGSILRSNGLQDALSMLMEHVKRVKPGLVIIDSFKVFDDLSKDQEELRKFTYELAINLMAWECTSFLIGEFTPEDVESNPLFSIADGIMRLSLREQAGEQQRFLQVSKMRGTAHSFDEHSLIIDHCGVSVYAPRVTIRRENVADPYTNARAPVRAKLGISKIDELLGEGVPYGSSMLISGVAGTGKTILLLEFIYRGAKEFNEKGIFFSFEETEERILAVGLGMSWDLLHEIKRGMIEIVFVSQPEIIVERDLLMMHERINKMKAKRVAVDSASIFVHKVLDPRVVREKIYQLTTLVQQAQAVGFLASDIAYGSDRISRFGVEETVVDGLILLTSTEKGDERERFIEVYKLRNTAHLEGKHRLKIAHGGLVIYPRIKLEKKIA
jgi:circadian clock protein KaiC